MARGGRRQATSYPLTKITLWVGVDDWEWLQARHRYHASRVIRNLIIEHRRNIEQPETPQWEALDLEGL
jgi:hypothetical protein